MEPFDLEAAKRGERIECASGKVWTEVEFIGTWCDGEIVCRAPWSYGPIAIPIGQLRMVSELI